MSSGQIAVGCFIAFMIFLIIMVAEVYHIPMLREARLDWILKKEN